VWTVAAGLTDRQYHELLLFRVRLRRFLRWSEVEARAVGLTPAQHQLLLAVRGHQDERGPTISELAGYLALRHHSVVELLDRAETGGLVIRTPDPDDGRVARILLTSVGRARLEELSQLHLQELQQVVPLLESLAEAVPRHT